MSGRGNDSPPLPEGARLLHIGPHKTGTTSVQGAFHAARRRISAQGVHYAGSGRHAVDEVQAAIDLDGSGGAGLRRWRRLVREIDRSRAGRVVLSSEWFADAAPPIIRRIVEELGGDRVHVAVTIRSLARVLPSQWQQYVAAGYTGGYEDWLRAIFETPDATPTPTFWWRHRHDQLVERWAEVVGASRVTVIVVDETDHDVVLRAFERLVGLTTGTLVADPDRSNRSLTLPEAEQMRALNAALAAAMPSGRARLKLGLFGAAAALRSRVPHSEEPRIRTPRWALDAAALMGAETVGRIRGSGVRIIGDLELLLREPREAGEDAPPVDPARETWLDVTTTAAVGVLVSSGLARQGSGVTTTAGGDATAAVSATDALEGVPTKRLVRVLLRRSRGLAPRLHGWRDWRPGRRLTVDGAARPPAGGPSAGGQERRPLTEEERGVLEAFSAALEEVGVAPKVRSKVVDGGALAELRDGTPSGPGVQPWPELGSRLVVGVVRAAGLVPPRDRRIRLAFGRTVETLDVAGFSTPALAAVAGRRLLNATLRRARGWSDSPLSNLPRDDRA